MRLLDVTTDRPVQQAQLYLSIEEARELRDCLNALLVDPELSDHEHLIDKDGWDLSFSILTERKLAGSRYTARERKLFTE